MEFFIQASSFAAPFFSDQSSHFIDADSERAALEKFAAEYRHPCGLYFAGVYTDANAALKDADPLLVWISNALIQNMGIPCGNVIRGIAPGVVEVNGVRREIADPKAGRITTWEEYLKLRAK